MDKSVRMKYANMQITAEGTISSKKNRNLDSIDKCAKDATKDEYYELLEAKSAVMHMKYFVKNAKHIIDQNSAKPKDYDKWTEKEQYDHIINNIKTYLPSTPDSLLFLTSAALHRGDCGRNSTDKPHWLDMEKFQRGQKFVRDNISSISLANMLSLFVIFVFEDDLKSLIFTKQSHTPYLAFKRYLSAACRIHNWMTEDPWTVGTQAYKDIQAVRKIHHAIRLKLCELDNEEIDTATKIQNPWCPDREIILEDFSSCPYPTVENGCVQLLFKSKGLNQADMAATQFSFFGIVLLYSHELGINSNDEDLAAFCHTWRGIGYLLGLEDRYNFCRGNLQEIKQRSRDFIDIWVRPYLRQVTPEWEHMMRCAVEGGYYYLNIYPFKVFLLIFTDLLNIDMPRVRNALTYYERLCLIVHRFLFDCAIKLPFIRVLMNKVIYKAINTATKFGPEKHKELEKRSQHTLDKGK